MDRGTPPPVFQPSTPPHTPRGLEQLGLDGLQVWFQNEANLNRNFYLNTVTEVRRHKVEFKTNEKEK